MNGNVVMLLLRKIGSEKGLETFLSTCIRLLSVPDACSAHQYVLSYLALLPILMVYHYTGVFVSSRLAIAAVGAVLYAIFPDFIPGPVDDVILLAASVPIDAIREFAQWVLERQEPPSLIALVMLPRNKRRRIEQFLYRTARKHAEIIVSAETSGEDDDSERRLVQEALEQLLGRKKQAD